MSVTSKKLAPFLREKEKNSKRYKAILSYFESENTQLEDECLFLNEHHDAVFAVIHERFIEKEETFQKGKSLRELISLLSILKKLVTHLSALINSRWQTDKIGLIIEKGLYRLNHPQVRSTSFELLLYFIESLQNSMEEKQILEFATAINLDVFLVPDVKLKHLPKQENVNSVLFPAAEPPSKKDSIDLLNGVLLEFISTRTKNFLFWFNLFKEKYLMVFYPKIFQELRLLDKYDECGFKHQCPPEIQASLIDRLAIWGESAQVFTIIWDVNANGHILLEIHRQTCLLPLDFATIIQRSVQLFRSWLMNFQKNKIFAEQLHTYWQQFIKNLALIFTLETTKDQIEAHYNLCVDVLFIYNYFAVELSSKHKKDTWEVLQYTMLTSTFDLLGKTSPNSSSHNKITIELLNKTTPSQKNKSETFSDLLFGALYFFWIRSQINSEETWKDLSKKATLLVHWKSNLAQWKEKMIQLTFILRDLLYEVDTKKSSEEKSIKKTTMSQMRESSTAGKSPAFWRDPRITEMNWTPEAIRNTWSNMLHILGNITAISDPVSHEIAMSTLYEIAVILTQAEEKSPQNTVPPIPIIKVLLPWLIEGCVYNERLIKGMLISYRTLCTLFCRRHTVYTTELNRLLSHFYRIIKMGLNNVKSEVIWEIIDHTTTIFHQDLPGVAILIPDFLRETEILCDPQTTVAPEVKRNALVIVNSLICYANHFETLGIPIDEETTILTVYDLKDRISKILLNVLNGSKEFPETLLLAMCGATTCIFEEVYHSSPRMPVIHHLINAILDRSDHHVDEVSQTAMDCLSALSLLSDRLDRSTDRLGSGSSEGHSSLSNLSSSDARWNASAISPTQSPHEGKFKMGMIRKERKHQNSLVIQKRDLEDLLEELSNLPSHGSFVIREAGECVLLQLLYQYNNFPSSGGSEVTSNSYSDYEVPNTLYFAYNDLILIALTEIPQPHLPGGKMCRITVRDPTGKYVWEIAPMYDVTRPNFFPGSSIITETSAAIPQKAHEAKVKSSRSEQTDMLQELLSYLNEADSAGPTCFGLSAVFHSDTQESFEQAIKEKIAILEDQQQQEDNHKTDPLAANGKVREMPTQQWETVSLSTFQTCRLFLTQLGFLESENRKRFHFLEVDPTRFIRNLRDLDQIYGRELFKIGIIYVAIGQEGQAEILRNSSGSPLYNEFVRGLGWMVDIKTHPGFIGGLDRINLANGKIAPYYATASCETAFHVITMMPSSNTDEQQIEKKRHVGNDYTHIIWSEHKRDYSPTTINSQFNDAHIVIYPLPNGLFRVQINKKEKLPFFGPLVDGMVLNKQILCPLVRQTAINASRRAREFSKGHQKPFSTRNTLLKEIIQRFKSPKTFDHFFTQLYPTVSDPETTTDWVSGK